VTPAVIPNQPMAEYLAMPAVSASLITTIIDECPAAALHASWMNPLRAIDATDEADIGTIAHALLLEGSTAGVAVVDPQEHPAEKGGGIPTGWTNKSIRAARDLARASGKIPVLKPQMAQINAMVDAARAFIHSLNGPEPAIWQAFQPDGGDSEFTFQWKEGDTLCKMRPDRISTDRALVINYKTTATSIAPDRWGRGPYLDYIIGAAWYRRGLRALFDVEASYCFLVQSTTAPYLCSLIGVDPHALALGESKCTVGLRKWQACVASRKWPGYPTRVAYPELPPWVDAAWEAQQADDPTMAYAIQP
jgi:PDDEXK-like domain of unknown function (DUF3799)